MKPVSEMTDDEIDEALAVDVKGWHLEGTLWKDKNDRVLCSHYNWHPTSNQNQAIELTEKMAFVTTCKVSSSGNEWHVMVDKDDDGKFCGSFNTSLSRAICEAVLMAVRGDEE